jgi:hypothetical protein
VLIRILRKHVLESPAFSGETFYSQQRIPATQCIPGSTDFHESDRAREPEPEKMAL